MDAQPGSDSGQLRDGHLNGTSSQATRLDVGHRASLRAGALYLLCRAAAGRLN